MFKRTKANKSEDRESVFLKPKVKPSREIKTHLKERTPIERIFYTFNHHLKRKTVFRMILGLPQQELDRNLYMISDMMLKTMLEDRIIDRMFFVVFNRLIQSRKAYAIKDLCIDYLKAQLSSDRQYLDFAEFLIRHFKDAIVGRREEVLSVVEDINLKKVISNLKWRRPCTMVPAENLIYFIR